MAKTIEKPRKKPSSKPASPVQTDARKVLLLDGHSLAFRAFFALPDTLVTSSGQVTNAVYGFTAMLIKLLADERPQGVVVCFDKGAPQFRLDRYAEYKAGRAATPDLFKQQLPLIREVLASLRIPMVELDGYEADDLLATLTKHAREEGFDVIIVTGDRDILQLVRDGVVVIMTRRGISDVIRYDPSTVLERYGVTPEKWIDFVALKGETADNLPGVPGVGDDVGLDLDPAKLRLEAWDDEAVRNLFHSLEFRSLHERLKELKFHGAGAASPGLEIVSTSEFTSESELRSGETIALAWNDEWLAVSDGGGEARILPFNDAMPKLAGALKDPHRQKTAHDAKVLFRAGLDAGVDIEGLHCDTKLAAYLLEPGASSGYRLQDTVSRYLGVSLDAEKSDPQPGEQGTLAFAADEKQSVCREAVAIRVMTPVVEEQLRTQGAWELATTLEFPLIPVLARMEHTGILVDRDYLDRLNTDFGQKMTTLEHTIQELAGEQFNVNSNVQLQRILFEKLSLPKTRKIKTGYSTDAAELEKLAGHHSIVASLLEYREVSKLKNGFSEMLLGLIDPKSRRIHTTYEQTTAATGRLSSTAPNLQNIPIRGDLGRQIRRAFIAPPGHVLLSADYSQIELRVLAHLSEDETFCQAFAQGHDFHATIAAKVYGVVLSDVTSEMRNQVKQFSYGIAYGMSTYGVSQRLGVEMDEAATFVETYYAQFPKVKEFLAAQVDKAKVDGFTTTMFGRRRYLPELQSSNFRLRALGERMALNAPIQGSAADILKKAMINVDAALRKEPVAKMLLTVHDELVFEVPEDKLSEARALIEREMTQATDLRCGLAVEVHSGANWADAHA